MKEKKFSDLNRNISTLGSVMFFKDTQHSYIASHSNQIKLLQKQTAPPTVLGTILLYTAKSRFEDGNRSYISSSREEIIISTVGFPTGG